MHFVGMYRQINIYSEQGHGVTIYSPRLTGAGGTQPVASRTPARAPRCSPRILLVEDEPAIRRAANRIFRDLGYVVVKAENGMQALEALDRYDDIALLCTDVVMPGGISCRARSELKLGAPTRSSG